MSAAQSALDESDSVLLDCFSVKTKADNSFVTEADKSIC